MTELTKEQLEAIERIKQNPVEFISYPKEKQFEELCLQAMKLNPSLLQYVQNQTPKLCMIALEQNPEAIEYFKI